MRLMAALSLLLSVLGAILASGSCQDRCSASDINTCGDCISIQGCAWCSQDGAIFTEQRCQPVANLTSPSSTCNPLNVENPPSMLKSTFPALQDNPIDLINVSLRLRVGDPQTFQVRVTPQRNLPLDLYILIDLSSSMDDELSTIQAVASRIAVSIRNITENVHLGFGAFNDKVVLPYAQEPLDISTCPSEYCPSFAFRHIVDFTSDSAQFSTLVSGVTVTVNVDAPENGLEGLAQVITCEEQIGWRKRVNGVGTRVVLFMTDQGYHYAGEGRFAGILNPYNGQCLLENNPDSNFLELVKFREYDYPSVGQILDLIRVFDVTTIFVISSDGNRVQSYFSLSEFLNSNSRRSSVASFSTSSEGDAENLILGLISTQYRNLIQDVALEISSSESLELTLRADCPDNSNKTMFGCNNVQLESSVIFNVTMTLKTCEGFTDGKIRKRSINSPSFGTFDIFYEAICDCDCAKNGIRDALLCNNSGVMECGVCNCDPLKCGSSCNRYIGNRTNLDCPRGGVNQEICSGPESGICDCGCVCNLHPDGIISGDACECTTFECVESRNSAGNVCNGRGLCCEGNCRCDLSPLGNIYRGDESINHCQCEPAVEVCIDPNDPSSGICNNRGTCGCNFCMCGSQYAGKYCKLINSDVCEYPPDLDCIRTCRDAAKEQSELPDRCTLCNPNRPLLFVNRDTIDVGGDGVAVRLNYEMVTNDRLGQSVADANAVFSFRTDQCTYTDSNGCIVDYVILANATHFALVANRLRDCSATTGQGLSIPIWSLAPIILGCLLVIGVALLILIKIIFLILDYIEVKRWESEAKDADFSKNQNPLYQSPEMKYENLAYGRE